MDTLSWSWTLRTPMVGCIEDEEAPLGAAERSPVALIFRGNEAENKSQHFVQIIPPLDPSPLPARWKGAPVNASNKKAPWQKPLFLFRDSECCEQHTDNLPRSLFMMFKNQERKMGFLSADIWVDTQLLSSPGPRGAAGSRRLFEPLVTAMGFSTLDESADDVTFLLLTPGSGERPAAPTPSAG